jgi:hypothetical protein
VGRIEPFLFIVRIEELSAESHIPFTLRTQGHVEPTCTRHELVHLYPLLASHGILIIDDFGHWEGAKKAVLEYFSGQDPLIHRVDYTGRLMVKP